MSIKYYAGTEGVTVEVESLADLAKILDILCSQCMDLDQPDADIAVGVLEEAMEKLGIPVLG